jgi:1-acyl-sn-glycerol-3-phosphate acyltransferase
MAIVQARETRRLPARLAGFCLALLGISFLLVTVLLCNILQCLSLFLLPFSVKAFKNANRAIAGFWWWLCVVWIKKVLRIKIDRSGDEVPAQENAVVFANHQQMPDIMVLMLLTAPIHRLGDMKWFVKDVLKYVPGIGWGMLFLDCLFDKRDWAADRARIEATFKKYKAHRISFWLISFVESTRITPKKLERAQEFAAKRGEYIPQMTLVPRSRGFIASIQGLGDRVDAIYDVTIAYEGGIPRLWYFLSGGTPSVALEFKRYPRAELPRTELELARWLADRFIEKDKKMIRYAQTGRL